MTTPRISIRLARKSQEDLADLAKIYGAESTSGFAREILETMVSSDPERIKAFNRRLMTRMGEQLALQFDSWVDSADAPKKAPRKAKKASAKKKAGRKSLARGKPT